MIFDGMQYVARFIRDRAILRDPDRPVQFDPDVLMFEQPASEETLISWCMLEAAVYKTRPASEQAIMRKYLGINIDKNVTAEDFKALRQYKDALYRKLEQKMGGE